MQNRILDSCVNVVSDVFDRILIRHRRHTETVKFEDPRRKAIYGSVSLSSDQMRQIDAFYVSHYGEKIPYVWHQYYTAFTGRFDPTYMPELIFIPEFEYFMNPFPEYVKSFGDKNVISLLAEGAGIKTPRVLLSCTKGFFLDGKKHRMSRDAAIQTLADIGEAFIKPSVDSSSGHGCRVINMVDGRNQSDGMTTSDLIAQYQGDFVVQECIHCHDAISTLYPGSVNTFRVITYRWKDQIFHCPAIMRIGSSGGFVDNAHAGGMFIAVSDEGLLSDRAFTEFRTVYTHHPDTGIEFDRYVIPGFSQVIDAARYMHGITPQLGMINWDFTIDNTGTPVLIEANTRGGSVWLIEIAHGCCAFGDRMPEILEWIRQQKALRKSSRRWTYFGQMRHV